MITVLIGQRGTGKSSLLIRLKKYGERVGVSFRIFDLDAEIEKRENQKVSEIFRAAGETHFRNLERKYFKILMEEVGAEPAFIAVGGGFDVRQIPNFIRVIWLQRISDQNGRIFLDRPSLDPQLPPLEEYQERWKQRVPRYREAAWEEYLLPEGLQEESTIESQIVIENPQDLGACLTLMPWVLATKERWNYFIQRRLQWGFTFFEIRDDLLSSEQIEWVLRDIPSQKLLWSRRCPKAPTLFTPAAVAKVDYDRKYSGEISQSGHSTIVSVHELKQGETLESLFEEMEVFERQGCAIKLAVVIENYQDLRKCHEWFLRNPKQRNLLPRSDYGRWLWYRLWVGQNQELNFLKEGEGSAADQPSLYQWMQRQQSDGSQFAALLGDPVIHSFTPMEQASFFANYRMPVLPIQILREEFDEAFPFLEELGIVAAAVTSPLKLKAYKICRSRTEAAENFSSVNTIFKNGEGDWLGHNTDAEGLVALIAKAQNKNPCADFSSVAVWGGGGTLPLIKKYLPEAKFFSLQTGELREGILDPAWSPQWVLWASGRFHTAGAALPPPHWQPQLVIDLNYRDDSGGLELAKLTGAPYLSGELMFRVQAQHQRRFWRPLLEGRR